MLEKICENRTFVRPLILRRKATNIATFLILVLVILYAVKKNSPVPSEEKLNAPNKISFIDNAEVIKHILIWTSSKTVPFQYMREGRAVFLKNKCLYNNCYVTADRALMPDLNYFDVIVFAGPEVIEYNKSMLPLVRSEHQKYVFASIESPQYFSVCKEYLSKGFFNWTWTYKLNSDVRWGFITVRDSNNNIIGPKKDMHWVEPKNMNPVSRDVTAKLKTKKRAAAWIVSNCITKSTRETFVEDLSHELAKYKLYVDIFGACGMNVCGHYGNDECEKIVEKYYYFYLAFENAISEDYVTEKVLHGLHNNAVPVVYGGANYSRFLPDGSYVDAMKLGPVKLAAKMHYLMNNPDEYRKYFRWKSHYSFHRTLDSSETNEYCKFCEIINDQRLASKRNIYKNLTLWWNEDPEACEKAENIDFNKLSESELYKLLLDSEDTS